MRVFIKAHPTLFIILDYISRPLQSYRLFFQLGICFYLCDEAEVMPAEKSLGFAAVVFHQLNRGVKQLGTHTFPAVSASGIPLFTAYIVSGIKQLR